MWTADNKENYIVTLIYMFMISFTQNVEEGLVSSSFLQVKRCTRGQAAINVSSGIEGRSTLCAGLAGRILVRS